MLRNLVTVHDFYGFRTRNDMEPHHLNLNVGIVDHTLVGITLYSDVSHIGFDLYAKVDGSSIHQLPSSQGRVAVVRPKVALPPLWALIEKPSGLIYVQRRSQEHASTQKPSDKNVGALVSRLVEVYTPHFFNKL